MRRLLPCVLLLPLLLHLPAASAAASDPPGVYHGRLRQLDVRLTRAAGEVRVDGSLDEAAWSNAVLLTGFSQYAPVDGLPAEDSTDVLVMYSDHAIYFGIRAYEPHGAVIATLADRDRIDGDDHIALLLDTFNDRRRAMLFAVNPRGVQSDGIMVEGAGHGGTDLSPDFLFESKGRLTDGGYEIEIRIPFKSIRYQSAHTQSWGINVIRRVQHSGHEQTWTPAERGQPSFLAQSGTFVDMTELKRGLVLDVNPVMTARATGAVASPSDAGWRYTREDPEFGGNLRWGVTANLTMNATVYPDFSQVEADVGQVAFDPRAALFFPEKRPFFLDGSENFSTPNQLIYTRRISSPEAAAKLNGKVGDLNVGVLSAIDDESFSATRDRNPLYNLVRLRRDLGAQSTAGLVYTDRIDGADYNRVAGVDTRMIVRGHIASAQLATSWTRTGESTLQGPLFDFAVSRAGRDFGWNASLRGVHPEFVAASGFIARTGIAHANAGPRWTFFRPPGSLVETYSVHTYLDGTWDYDRFERGTEPNDIKWHVRLNGTLRGGWRGGLMTFVESFKYPAGLYSNYHIERRARSGAVIDTVPYTGTDRLSNFGGTITLNSPQWQTFAANLQLVGGYDDNFDEWSSAWISFTTVSADWRPTQRVRVNGRFLEQRFHRVSDGSLVRLSTIPRVKVEYQVARPIFVRFVGQYNATKVDALRDDSRTNDPVLFRNADGTFRRSAARASSGFRSDLLFSYQPNPGTVIFAGYGSTLSAPGFFEPGGLERAADGFFVKLSYLFRL
ncbi:MAG TPA: DUF5916 domain-containing protein [Longimicrobiales bacterium]|nr:DUF5916 domain-containing protein [Longimicrobiales bacterium]